MVANNITSQNIELAEEGTVYENLWMVGIGTNIVDDSGDFFHTPFNINNNWNVLPYPSRISIGRYLSSGLGLEIIGSYNKYKVGKIIGGAPNLEETDYLALDTRFSYDLNKVIGETGFFDPYIGLGGGYTKTNSISGATVNGVVGFRTWFSSRLGLDFNASRKWYFNAIKNNHIQYGLGIVYQFELIKWEVPEREKTKLSEIANKINRNKSKLDLINKVKQDSISEAKALAKKIIKEKQDTAKSKLEVKEKRKKQIEKAISDIGFVYFDFNSSYLNKESKEGLDKLVLILKTTPSLIIKISAYTDSRGADNYNLWLSKRRVKRTADYLAEKGIPLNQLIKESYGEDKLLNECDNFTYCEEEKHKINRRSEFSIVEF